MIKFFPKKNKESEPITLKRFNEKRNKILMIRDTGGLGDILMHRMMFEDIKLLMPEAEIIFACPSKYHDAVYDHPFLSEIVDFKAVNYYDYIVHYDTSRACGSYEMKKAPFADKHRSDIWANHCGLELTKHNMHINLEEKFKLFGLDRVNKIKNGHLGPAVLICPVSAMVSKNLSPKQLIPVVKDLQSKGYFVFALHSVPIECLTEIGVQTIYDVSIREWMGVIDAADYVISVDTSSFHYAGGTGKPMVGIFSWADGKVYGKYYSKFLLVQKHRDHDPNWTCGPCYCWSSCPKTKSVPKPCLTEITPEMILKATYRMIEKWPIQK